MSPEMQRLAEEIRLHGVSAKGHFPTAEAAFEAYRSQLINELTGTPAELLLQVLIHPTRIEWTKSIFIGGFNES